MKVKQKQGKIILETSTNKSIYHTIRFNELGLLKLEKKLNINTEDKNQVFLGYLNCIVKMNL